MTVFDRSLDISYTVRQVYSLDIMPRLLCADRLLNFWPKNWSDSYTWRVDVGNLVNVVFSRFFCPRGKDRYV